MHRSKSCGVEPILDVPSLRGGVHGVGRQVVGPVRLLRSQGRRRHGTVDVIGDAHVRQPLAMVVASLAPVVGIAKAVPTNAATRFAVAAVMVVR